MADNLFDLYLPDTEKEQFLSCIEATARQSGLPVRDYLNKVWYHEQAVRLGEYMAIVLMQKLIDLYGFTLGSRSETNG